MAVMKFTSGLPETRCGYGSTLRFTEPMRPQLGLLLKKLAVRTLVDAPCGDCNWMAHVDLSGVKYTGIDFDEEHLRAARDRIFDLGFAPRDRIYLRLDIANSAIPVADLILCRDFMQHLPNETICKVIHNFRKSGSRWLLATNHVGGENTDISTPGGFHPVNLTRSPFNFLPPLDSIPDGEKRILGLWRL